MVRIRIEGKENQGRQSGSGLQYLRPAEAAGAQMGGASKGRLGLSGQWRVHSTEIVAGARQVVLYGGQEMHHCKTPWMLLFQEDSSSSSVISGRGNIKGVGQWWQTMGDGNLLS